MVKHFIVEITVCNGVMRTYNIYFCCQVGYLPLERLPLERLPLGRGNFTLTFNLNKMEELDITVVDDNDISYGKSNKGYEVMIINDSEIFHKRKIGKRTLTNICTISWNCKNKSNCNAALLSCRDNPDTDGSDYNVTRVQNRGHTELCTINRTDVIVLKHLNYLMEQCEEPGVNQQIAYENVFNELVIHSPIASQSFPAYNA
jgi:hypothetical protein